MNSTTVSLADPVAEERLLGVLLTERSAPLVALSLGVGRDDFHYEINSMVWDYISDLVENGRPVDQLNVINSARNTGMIDVIGGTEYIEKLVNSDHDASLLAEYVTIIRDRSLRRRLNTGIDHVLNELHTEPSGKKLIDNAQKHIWRAIDPYIAQSYSGIKSSDIRSRIETATGYQTVIPYSFPTLNAVNKGRRPGTLTVWGGYTSDGKSVIGLTESITAALMGYRVGFFGLEMTDDEMVARILCQMAGVDPRRIEDNTLSEADMEKLAPHLKDLDESDLTMYCDPNIEPGDICNIQMRERYDLIVIDYLQRFDFRDFRELPSMAKRFKNLALSTKTCVDLLSQLTPKEIKPGDNPFTKPDNNSLYGGKAIAHEANNVHYIWAARTQDDDGGWVKDGTGKVIVSKARGGRANWEFDVRFKEETLTWEE